MHRYSRGKRPAPSSPAASAKAEETSSADCDKAVLSPPRPSRHSADYNASKYPLSPVFEQGSFEATPVRGMAFENFDQFSPMHSLQE